MNEYGVVQLGGYLLSVPGAFLYAIGIFLSLSLARGLAENSQTEHFKLTKFIVYALLLSFLTTVLWIQLGVWFYVKA